LGPAFAGAGAGFVVPAVPLVAGGGWFGRCWAIAAKLVTAENVRTNSFFVMRAVLYICNNLVDEDKEKRFTCFKTIIPMVKR
jgi:hypothetical protein